MKAHRRATELVLPAGVKADDEANSVVSASTAAGRGVMVLLKYSSILCVVSVEDMDMGGGDGDRFRFSMEVPGGS